MKQIVFFIIFKGLSQKQTKSNFSEGESATLMLITLNLNIYLRKEFERYP